MTKTFKYSVKDIKAKWRLDHLVSLSLIHRHDLSSIHVVLLISDLYVPL